VYLVAPDDVHPVVFDTVAKMTVLAIILLRLDLAVTLDVTDFERCAICPFVF
jgi:hypothetical protein